MSTSARSATPWLLLATAAVAWGIGIATAAPAVAEPGDSSATSPTAGGSTVPPLPSTVDGLWNRFAPPIPIVGPTPISTVDGLVNQFIPGANPVGTLDGFVGQFVPTRGIDLATLTRGLLQYFEQFRPPAPTTPPTG